MQAMSFKNMHAVVIGLGMTGQSCVRFLHDKGATISAMDSRASLSLEEGIAGYADIYLGSYDEAVFERADLIVISPGVNPADVPLVKVKAREIDIIGDVELFARFNQKPVIAITGSNGKSTVTTLTAHMLNASGIKAEMGGNIGKPVLSLLDSDADMFVLELSSFQLETVTSLTPHVATVLNVSDDHLDRHGDVSTYANVKRRIYQGTQHAVINRDDPNTWPLNIELNHSFGLSANEKGFSWNSDTHEITRDNKRFLAMSECKLIGGHNALNIQAAAMCALLVGADEASVKRAAREFAGLPHRFETVAIKGNVTWINDSKATNVGATLAALQGLKGADIGKLILLAGGDSKGADFSPLKRIFAEQVNELIVFGKDAQKLIDIYPAATKVDTLEQAVSVANQKAKATDVVLLSPACASLDMFDNYQHRGNTFARAVEALAA